jgi:hypothetical protein
MSGLEKEGLVMFSFQHFQFAGIHAGIQSGHCWVEMAAHYKGSPYNGKYKMFWEWAQSHKTVNIRNGGDQTGLIDIIKILKRPDNPYPWMQWQEDKSCNHCLTNVSIIVPEHVYSFEMQSGCTNIGVDYTKTIKVLTDFDVELYNLIKSTRHAN